MCDSHIVYVVKDKPKLPCQSDISLKNKLLSIVIVFISVVICDDLYKSDLTIISKKKICDIYFLNIEIRSQNGS